MNTADAFAPDTDIDLRRIWSVVTKNKWVILGVPLVFAVLAKIAVAQMTPMFAARATIMIENDNANIVSIEQVYEAQRRNAQYFDTQYAILRARPLAEEVVQDLDIASHWEYDPEHERNKTPAWRDWRSWLGIEREPPRLTPEERAVYVYMDRLSIRPIPRTQLVDVVFESADPRLAARVANAHAQAYIEGTMEARLGLTETAIQWMSKKLEDLQANLTVSEQRLQDFREQYGVIDYEGLKALPSQEISNLVTSLTEARQLVSQTRAAYLQAFPNGGSEMAEDLASIRAIQDDPVSQDYQQELAEARSAVDDLSKNLNASHPRMIDAQAGLRRAEENLRAQHESVAERIRNEYEQAQGQQREVEAALDRAKAGFQAIGRTEAEFLALERDVNTNRELYDMFYSRIKETAQTEDLQQADARVLSPAINPIRPFSPNESMIVGLVFVGSLFFALLSAFVAEAMNDRIDISSVENRLGVSMLSMVPVVSNRKKFGSPSNLFVAGTHPPYKESIRTLRTSISLSSTDELSKVVLITSALGDEGKSTIAVNLAHAFAQMEKVLLVDGDLRKPSIARRMKLPMDHLGFTDLLSKKISVEDAIIETASENLDVMTSGSGLNDVLQMLSSRQMGAIMRVLRIKYDRIIFDSPPTLPVSDAPVLSTHSDAVVLVTKSKSTRLLQAKSALAKLNRADAPIAGVVVNQWDMHEKSSYAAYGYYGYGESPDDFESRKAAS